MSSASPAVERQSRRTALVVWSGAIFLVLIGVVAAAARVLFPGDLTARIEHARPGILATFGVVEEFPERRAKEIRAFDQRFGSHRVATLLHVLPGSLYLVLGLLQFSERIRSQYLRFHRWSGRLLVLTGSITAVTGLYFAIVMPIGGFGETSAIVLFGTIFLVSLANAILAIRRHDVARHREWMIRAFSVGVGISMVRIVGGPLDIMLTPAGYSAAETLVIAMWTGFSLSVAGGELWIRHTRRSSGDTIAKAQPA